MRVAEVGPAHGRDFELGFLPGVVAAGGALDGAVGNFVGGFGAGGCEWECGFEEDVGLVPVDVVVDEDSVCSRVEGDVLDEFGGLPGAGDSDGFTQGAVGEEGDAVEVGDGRHVVEGAWVDIPGVVLLRGVFEGLKLVAAGVGSEVGTPIVGVAKRSDAAAFLVDLERNNAIAEAKTVCCFIDPDTAIIRSAWRPARLLLRVDDGENGIAEGGNVVGAY